MFQLTMTEEESQLLLLHVAFTDCFLKGDKGMAMLSLAAASTFKPEVRMRLKASLETLSQAVIH